jgi:hypothetical protein
MFHDEVLTAEGRAVDFDRASVLMDRELLSASLRAMMRERNTSPRWDAVYDAQWVWEDYCERHLDRYGEEFGPEINPAWDSAVSQPESAPPPRPPARR